jgi:maltose-binding protein MalE
MPKTVTLDLDKKQNKIRVYGPYMAALIIIAVIITAFGYWVGKREAETNFLGSTKTASSGTTNPDWLVWETKDFSIEYPKDWQTQDSEKNSEPKKISNEGGQIKIWIDTDHEHRFSKKQRAQIKKETKSKINVNERKAQVTQFEFKSGEFFVIALLPTKSKKPKITFWIATTNKESKDVSLEILKTFKGKELEKE